MRIQGPNADRMERELFVQVTKNHQLIQKMKKGEDVSDLIEDFEFMAALPFKQATFQTACKFAQIEVIEIMIQSNAIVIDEAKGNYIIKSIFNSSDPFFFTRSYLSQSDWKTRDYIDKAFNMEGLSESVKSAMQQTAQRKEATLSKIKNLLYFADSYEGGGETLLEDAVFMKKMCKPDKRAGAEAILRAACRFKHFYILEKFLQSGFELDEKLGCELIRLANISYNAKAGPKAKRALQPAGAMVDQILNSPLIKEELKEAMRNALATKSSIRRRLF